ncbi:MAG: enoyl-CoA hydratase [Hyphomicrobiaceae bacterium]|nr:enoyl-CoA hydratase [Hyphomicrobiaceae bacterium]
MPGETEKLIVAKDGPIGRLTLNQPQKRNAIGYDMWRGIGDAMEEFAGDDTVRVVIVSGAGGKAFSAGADISEFKEHRSSPETRERYDAAMRRAFDLLYNLPRISIAKIDGVCVGGGAEVAMDCDILIASDASRFGITPARLGLGYSLLDIDRLVRHLGAKRAKEVLATAKLFNADDALAMGWVNKVVPSDRIDAHVEELASQIAANAPLTLKASKLIVNEAVKPPDDRDLDICRALVEDCYASDDYIEGQRAFAEKRTPDFTGH